MSESVCRGGAHLPGCEHAEILAQVGLEIVNEPSPKEARIAFLERKREATKADLLLKFEDGDYHGVADAAMDLRDIESELKGLRHHG